MLELLQDRNLFGNSLFDFVLFGVYAAGGIVVVWAVKSLVIRRFRTYAEKSESAVDDAIVRLADRFIVPLIYFGVLYLSILGLDLNETIRKTLNAIGATLLTFLGVRFILETFRFALFDFWVKKQPDAATLDTQFRTLMPLITIIVWGTGVVFLLSNLGFNIAALVTGLGIGGVAVAIAGSAILSDLFSYLAIMFDKPFVLGDFLIVGDFLGSVEHIGIKTTRLRSLGGEQLVFSNKDLTDSRIKNYKRMAQRRVLFKLGVVYETPVEKLKEIPGLIRSIIESAPNTQFDRAHFSAYGDFNLVIEAVYYVLSADYNAYMDIQQAINFQVKEEFEKRKIEFAFPTQTLYLERSGGTN